MIFLVTPKLLSIFIEANLSSIFIVLVQFTICLLIIFNIVVFVTKEIVILRFYWSLNLLFGQVVTVFGLRILEETIFLSIVGYTFRSCFILIFDWLYVDVSIHLLLAVIHNAAILIREISWLPWTVFFLSFLISLTIGDFKLLLFKIGLLCLMLSPLLSGFGW
jgi:hypothetical protein